MIEQFVNFVIRPPCAEYSPDQYLWEPEFTLAGRKYKRLDLELTNERSQTLKCSHYIPDVIPENTALPCVIYCHGNSGCRADANETAIILLPSNITLFTLDFAGSGLSDGEYVSLGWHEKQDLKCAVSFLRNNNQVNLGKETWLLLRNMMGLAGSSRTAGGSRCVRRPAERLRSGPRPRVVCEQVGTDRN